MSVATELFAGAALPLLLDVHGEEFAVVPAGGEPVTVMGLVGLEELKTIVNERGRFQVRERRFSLLADSTSRFGGVDALERNATITYGDESWAIRGTDNKGDGAVVAIGHIDAPEQRAAAGRLARN